MPPGISRENVKKRKTSTSEGSEELEESGQEEQQPPELNIASRQRRTAALKSHKVWDVLKPGAKMHAEEETEPSEAPLTAPRGVGRPSLKRKTPSSFTSPSEESAKMETDHSTENAKDQTDEKTTDEQMLTQTGTQRVIVNRKIAAASLSATNLWPQPQPAKDRGQLQLIEKEVEKHQQFADEPMTNAEELSDDDDEEEDKMSQHGDRVLLDDPNDEDYPEFHSRGGRRGRGELHHPRGRGRGSRGGAVVAGQSLRGTTSTRGRPRGSRMPMGGGVMGGRYALGAGAGRGSRMQMGYFPPSRATPFGSAGTLPIYSLQPSGGIVGDLQSRPTAVRIVRARPAGEVGAHPPGTSPGFRSLNVRAPPNYGEESFKINRELDNYRDSIVQGTSVQQFNDIIDQLLNELSRAADDREKLLASHRDYIDHLQTTHSAAQEIKDKRIKQLEQSLEQMQQKLMLSFKHEQLQIVKTNFEGNNPDKGGGEGEQKQQQQMGHRLQQMIGREGVGGCVAGDSAGGSVEMVGHSPNLSSAPSQLENLHPSAGGPGVRTTTFPIGQNQRMRTVVGTASEGSEGTGQMPHAQRYGINSPYDDEYDGELEDDEEDFDYDEGDSADIDDDLGAQVTI